MDLLVFGSQRLKMGGDRLTKRGHPYRTEPAGLGMNHVFELIAPACEFRKLFADRIFRQLDITSLATTYLVRRGGIGCKQPGIRAVGLGFDAHHLPISIKARGMDDLDRKLRLA